MFHIDVTAEDCRLIAVESPNVPSSMVTLDVTLIDNLTGRMHKIFNVSFCDVEKLVSGMICCHGDVSDETYPHLEKLLEGCPIECRPIPWC